MEKVTDRPVTGEHAPVLKVLASTTPMARMIRERLAAEDATAASGETGVSQPSEA